MSFDRPIAPGLLKGGENGRFVSTEVFGEVGQRACGSGITPTRPCGGVPLPDDAAELTRQRGACGDLRGPSTRFFKVGPGFFRLFQ